MSFLQPLPGTASPSLSKRQKAAVVVHMLISGGVDPGIRDLPRDQQRMLVHDMAGLRFVDKETLAQVVSEFAQELDSIGLHVPRDPAKVLAALDGILSLDVADGLAAELGLDSLPGAGPWSQLAGLDADVLLGVIAEETDEVCAILMSKLPPAAAADLMKQLPDGRADVIAAAFARTEEVSPDVLARIGSALGQQTSARKPLAFETDGVKRVAAILNSSTGSVRGTILDSLDKTDAEFAARVRAAVFSFENIPDRVDARDVPKVIKEIESADLVTALGGAPKDQKAVGEFLLGSMSKRMAEQLREEIQEKGVVALADAEEAMTKIVAAIRRLEESGQLILNVPGEG